MMLPVKTDKDVIRYLREALKIQEHNTNNMAAKYCKIYKMYKAYRRSKLQERNYDKKNWEPGNIYSSLALARGQRLQATGRKLKASGGKLDKKKL